MMVVVFKHSNMLMGTTNIFDKKVVSVRLTFTKFPGSNPSQVRTMLFYF